MAIEARDSLENLLFERAPFPVLVHDRTRILDLNQRAITQLRGTSATQFVGRPITDVIHPLAREAGESRREMLLAGQRFWRVDTKMVAADGTEFTVNGCAIPFQFNGEGHVVAMALPLECPESAHGESPVVCSYPDGFTLRQAALDAIPAGLVAMRGFGLVYVNPATVRLMRAGTADDLIGTSVLDLVDDVMREPLRERFSIGVMFASPDRDVPGMVRGLDGSSLRIMCRGCLIEDGQDALRMWVITSAEVAGDEAARGVPE